MVRERRHLKVLLLNYEFPPIGGGAGNATANIARCLAAVGDEVQVVTASYADLARVERRENYTVLRVPAHRRHADRCTPFEMLSYMVGAILPSFALARRWRPDVCLVFFGIPTGPIALVLRQCFSVPYVVSLRGADVPGFVPDEVGHLYALATPLIRAVWLGSSGLVAVSPGLARLARQHWPAAPIGIIPNGIDVEAFRPPSERSSPARPFKLLFVGRLADQKGVKYLLEALSTIDYPVQLRVIGDGPLRASLEALATELNVGDHVEFSGWVDREQLLTHYWWADAFVLPSLNEGMPNVVLEAFATGLPVIGTDVPGTEDLVHEGQNGFLVPVRDPVRLGNAVLRLANAGTGYQRMRLAARQTALSLRWENITHQYRVLLSAAARNDPAPPSSHIAPTISRR